MLYIIGLGLADAKDVSIRGHEIIKNCQKIYLEAYTSILLIPIEELKSFYGRDDIIEADRTLVEQQAERILDDAEKGDTAFLVVGDALSATTHTDLIIRAMDRKIPFKVLHNASIMNAIGCTGLQLYRFGETVSIVFWEDNWKPVSFFEKIVKNRVNNFHTLCLLDIKMKEQSVENMMKNNNIFEPPRWMTCQVCCEQFLEILEQGNEDFKAAGITPETKIMGVSKVGSDKQKMVYASIAEHAKENLLGEPLHSLVIPAEELHELELEFLDHFKLDN